MSKNDLNQISKILDEKLDVNLKPIHNELKRHGKLLKSLKKDQDAMLKILDSNKCNKEKG